MATREQAQAAKVALLSLLQRFRPSGRPSWLRGVGISEDENGSYAVKVNVQAKTSEVMAVIPASMGDVPIIVEAVGDIRALKVDDDKPV